MWILESHLPTAVRISHLTRYFVALQRELWEGEGRVLICKVREEGRRAVQTIPVKAFEVGRFQVMFRRERWKHCFEAQSLDT